MPEIGWKLIQRIEEINDQLESIEDYLDQVYDTHQSFGKWMSVANEMIIELNKEITFIKNKKTCV
jgi:archaellum component FlaC